MKRGPSKPLADSDRQVLLEGIPQLKRSANELWAVLELNEELGVLLTDIYGWSVLLLKDFLRDHLKGDSDQIDWLALKIAGIQAMLRDREEMIRAVDVGLWPPPRIVIPECSLARKYRLLREASDPGFSASVKKQSVDGIFKSLEADINDISDDWEVQKKRQLERRRAKNGYIAPIWTLTFKTRSLSPNRKSRVIRLLMESLRFSLAQATNTLPKLLAGEHVTIQLSQRADWYPLRESLRKCGVAADVLATYPKTGTRISAETELAEAIDHEE